MIHEKTEIRFFPDRAGKSVEKQKEIMAPVLNHYIYGGEAVIRPEDMTLVDGEYSGLEIKGQYIEISRLRDVFYDVNVRRADGVQEHFRVGFENRSTDSKELVIKNNTYNVMDSQLPHLRRWSLQGLS